MWDSWEDVADLISLVSRKWVIDILAVLASGPRRHNELRRAVGRGLHTNTLDHTLHRLESVGFVERKVLPDAPPGVVYELTKLGRSLLEPLTGLGLWVEGHREELTSRAGWPKREQ